MSRVDGGPKAQFPPACEVRQFVPLTLAELIAGSCGAQVSTRVIPVEPVAAKPLITASCTPGAGKVIRDAQWVRKKRRARSEASSGHPRPSEPVRQGGGDGSVPLSSQRHPRRGSRRNRTNEISITQVHCPQPQRGQHSIRVRRRRTDDLHGSDSKRIARPRQIYTGATLRELPAEKQGRTPVAV